MATVAEDIAEILLDIKAVTISPTKPYRYSSGLLSPVYTDNRLLMSYPNERRRVIAAWVELIKEIGEFDVIAGTATAGIPHGAWISDQMSLPMVYARSKAKEHGKQNQIEGILEPGQRVIVVEDLISTAKSSLDTITAVKDKGGVANTISAIFYYTLPQAAQNLQDAGVSLRSLTTFPVLVTVAADKGYIKPEEHDVVLDWLQDSAGWGHRHGFE